MMRDKDKQTSMILSIIGIIPTIWLGLLIAPAMNGGLSELLSKLGTIFDNPFHIEICKDSLKTVLILLLCYGIGIGVYFSSMKNYRRREEHGSAKWGSAKKVNKKYQQKPLSQNKLMTQTYVLVSMQKHIAVT